MTTTFTAADLVVEGLENESTDRIFGLPGEENLDLLDALRRSGIELVLTRHEQTQELNVIIYVWMQISRFLLWIPPRSTWTSRQRC